MVLVDAPGRLASSGPADAEVLGAVVDIPSQGGTATIVALGDGTTSLYTSTGGGTIGAGSHAPVANATRALLAVLDANLAMFPPDERVDLPSPDLVAITLLTRSGRRRAHVESAAFWGEVPSTVGEMIAAIQGVLTAMRGVNSS